MRRNDKNGAIKNFCFDEQKERAIYECLCNNKLSRRQKRLLTDDIKFKKYNSWKQYFVNRYEVYNKDSLTEFSRYLNQLLRDSKKTDEFWKGFCMAVLSMEITCLVGKTFIEEVSSGVLYMLFATIALIIAIIVLATQMFGSYDQGAKRVYFLQDVKEIIDELIEQK